MDAMVIPARFTDPLTINVYSLYPEGFASAGLDSGELCSAPPASSAQMMVSLTALDMLATSDQPVCDVILNTPCDAGTWNGCYDSEVCTAADKCECVEEACLSSSFECVFEGVYVSDSSPRNLLASYPVLHLLLVVMFLFRH